MAKDKNLSSQTIVCLTPLPVLEDSRVMRMAASFARWGYNSIVIEDGMSKSPVPFPFGLISLGKSAIQTQAVPQIRALWRIQAIRTAAYIVINGIPLLKTTFMPHIYRNGYMTQYRDRVKKVLPEANLYLLRSYVQYPAIKGKPFIYDASDFYSALWNNVSNPEKKWAMPFHEKVEQECTEKALAIITVSNGLIPLFAERFGRSPELVRNCYDTRLDAPAKQTLKAMLGLTNSDFLAAVVGTAKGGMAIPTTLEALEQLPSNVHLAFVGKRHKDYGPRTHSVGAVPANEVVPFISDADCILIIYFALNSSYRYCLPNSLFQGIAAKIPILYPMLPEIACLASKYNLGLSIDPFDPASIASGINKLMAYKSTFDLEKAAAELSWEVEEQRLKQIIERLL